MLPFAVREAFVDACLLDITALKPGNVGIHGAGHRMRAVDFVASAAAAAGPLTEPAECAGERVLRAVTATQAAVGTNTNLGILLLAAPMVHAALQLPPGAAWPDFTQTLHGVLEKLSQADAAFAFAAIAAANPGGLGRAERHDVREPPQVTLLEAMREAAGRDRIAAQYANGFSDILGFGLGELDTAHREGASWPDAVARVFLAFLARYPDSHAERKLGASQATALRGEAAGHLHTGTGSPYPGHPARADLLIWDRSLKARGINPGTSADLAVATAFAGLLRQALPELSPESSLSRARNLQTGGVKDGQDQQDDGR